MPFFKNLMISDLDLEQILCFDVLLLANFHSMHMNILVKEAPLQNPCHWQQKKATLLHQQWL
jgi:hypothetical protein